MRFTDYDYHHASQGKTACMTAYPTRQSSQGPRSLDHSGYLRDTLRFCAFEPYPARPITVEEGRNSRMNCCFKPFVTVELTTSTACWTRNMLGTNRARITLILRNCVRTDCPRPMMEVIEDRFRGLIRWSLSADQCQASASERIAQSESLGFQFLSIDSDILFDPGGSGDGPGRRPRDRPILSQLSGESDLG